LAFAHSTRASTLRHFTRVIVGIFIFFVINFGNLNINIKWQKFIKSANNQFKETGNPDGLPALYSGIATGQTLENHLIYRPPLMSADGSREVHPALRTSIYDNTWLNGWDNFILLKSFFYFKLNCKIVEN
jgi:hypothetical protein